MHVSRMQQNIDLFSFELSSNEMIEIEAKERGRAVAWPTGDPTLHNR